MPPLAPIEKPAVGIIANPASGRDVRRLVAKASVFHSAEKSNMVQRALTADVIARADGAASPEEMLATWQRDKAGALERAGHLLTEMRNVQAHDLPMLSVVLRELRNLA